MQTLVPNSNCYGFLGHPSKSLEASIYFNKQDKIEDIAIVAKEEFSDYQVFSSKLTLSLIGQKIEEIDFPFQANIFEQRICDFVSAIIEKYRSENYQPIFLKNEINPKEIICRCNGIEKKELMDLVDTYYADPTLVFKNSMLGQVCGSCSEDVKEACKHSIHAGELLFGKTVAFWKNKISQILQDSISSLPKEYKEVEFEFISFKKGLLKIRCGGNREGLKRPEIQSVIRHHLQGVLQIPLEVSIVF